ncbi:helix-turn-helix transcriptional regulator [Mycolicibacterium pulveris]|uniref:helix-turn-helix transcriptional regulator n=1 Tax=Mycolicibacterium pulveris TaxID=36813 RepID=UPI003CEBF57A
MTNTGAARPLRGRREECAALDRVISTVRSGRSQVLVLRGEAGVGKSALLDYVADNAAGSRVLRTAGVESEMELAFAGLQQLCAPLADHSDALPAPQHAAVDTAFGRSAGPAPDRFLVGLAVLSLLASAARDQPLVCLIDDAQWLDRVSIQTLAFVARRLLAEPVALIFAARDGSADESSGLPTLAVGGLRPDDARALLESVIPGRLDERVRDRIVAETRGNPLALLELPRDLSAAELAGGFGRPDSRPLANIEQTFLRRIELLPPQTQRLLLIAAAEPVGDAVLLMRAAQRLGVSLDAGAPAQGAGLIDIDTSVRFRHPLVRSAAYRAADPQQRRAVHQALAEATDPAADPDRRAWHLANAASGPDEQVAAELERSADRAQARGGIASAAAFLERATELTMDPVRRGARALAAAQAKRDAADLDGTDQLLAVAQNAPLDALQRARLVRLHAQIAFAKSRGGDSSMSVSETAVGLLHAAKGLETLDDGLSRETYLEAMGAAMHGGRLCPLGGAVEVAEPARLAPPGPQPPRPIDLLLEGLSARVTDGHAASVATLRNGLTLLREEVGRGGPEVMTWLWLAFPVAQESAVHELWDDDLWHQLATEAVRLARGAGTLAVLPVTLAYRAGVHVQAGELATAAELIAEADAITAATGYVPVKFPALMLSAWRGVEAEAMALIDAAAADATARGDGRLAGSASYATAVLNNGLGRYELARVAAENACDHEDLGLFGWSLVELIEAASRSGGRPVASKALGQLEERTVAGETDWARGIYARSQALLAPDDSAEPLYREAIERLGATKIAVHLARARLIYGEWLRRCNRRADARVQLNEAHEMFTGMGAEAFAERTRRELIATGEKMRKKAGSSGEQLTAQEAQIARLAGEGLTNQEIGAQLFISTHTVEWHLRKVFVKLGITSRRQLRKISWAS